MQVVGDEKTSNLWSLLPSFDPSMDNAKEYADKVRFLWGICPPKDRGMLAPRLTLFVQRHSLESGQSDLLREIDQPRPRLQGFAEGLRDVGRLRGTADI